MQKRLHDPYVYPGTDVLINKLEIRDLDTLGNAESLAYIDALIRGISNGQFNLSHLKNIHKELFSNLYNWAGQIRTVDISKGNSTFCRSDFIESEANKLFNNLLNIDHCLTMIKDKAEFIKKFADYYCEVNVLHPFREGNGRSTRIFFEQLALHNGYSFDFSKVTKDQWITASIDGFNCDNSGLERIFSVGLQPLKLEKVYKFTLVDVKSNKHVNINTNEDVLKYFEQFDHTNKISTWREICKVKTESDFHFLDNENPERVAIILSRVFNVNIMIEQLDTSNESFTENKCELEK